MDELLGMPGVPDGCADACTSSGTYTFKDASADTCTHAHSCADICTNSGTDAFIDAFADTCAHACTDACIDAGSVGIQIVVQRR